MKKCKGCSYYARRTWTQKYYPSDYHAIGMTHAYGYCRLHQTRCSDIKSKTKQQCFNETL